jgi:Arc/MetJ-type ribon-helix-helix transcriptional regulator
MAQLAIELDDQQQRQVNEAVASGRFDSAGAYIGELIKRDQELQRQRLMELIKEGDESRPLKMTPEQIGQHMERAVAAARETRGERVA